MGCQHGFELVASRCTDKPSSVLCKNLIDGTCVVLLDRLAGQDHGSGVDVLALQSSRLKAPLNELLKFLRIDAGVGLERCEDNWRLPPHLTAHHFKVTAHCMGVAAQVYSRKQQMRGRRSDVNSHRLKHDVVLIPNGLAVLGVKKTRLMLMVELKIVGQGLLPKSRNGKRIQPSNCQAGALGHFDHAF